MRFFDFLLVLFTSVALTGCRRGGENAYTLYRNSVADEGMRVHVATFDVEGTAEYNQKNCERARTLFQQQPDAQTRFWCEKGFFRR